MLEDNDWEVGNPDPTINQMREMYRSISMHAPTLDENMNPKFELLNMTCPLGRRQYSCMTCDQFKGVFIDNDNINSYSKYEGFCGQKDDT
jgi:hypothetical protein